VADMSRAPKAIHSTLDCQFDQTAKGRMLKLLNVIDEYSRECLATDVARSIDADALLASLERLAAA
jgi:putative transposase